MSAASKVNVGELVDKIVDNLNEEFSVESVPIVIPQLLIELRKFKKLKAEEKKELVEVILKEIVDRTDGPGNDDIWDPILKRLIPRLVDTFLDVQNGKLKLKKRKFLWLC